MSRPLGHALRWMRGLFADVETRYQVVGGLAARGYGATRPLVDIDVYVPDDDALHRIAEHASELVVRPPARYRDEHWNLTYLRIHWEGWDIEAGAAADAKVWSQEVRDWTPADIRFDRSVLRRIEGVELPLMPREQLLGYKEALGRDVDTLDAAQIRGVGPE